MLYHEAGRSVKKNARKTVGMKELLLTTVNNLKSFFHFLNNKKEIRSGITTSTDGAGNLVNEDKHIPNTMKEVKVRRTSVSQMNDPQPGRRRTEERTYVLKNKGKSFYSYFFYIS